MHRLSDLIVNNNQGLASVVDHRTALSNLQVHCAILSVLIK